MNHSIDFLISLAVLLAQNSPAQDNRPSQTLLPTGVRLVPAGRSYDVGNMPMAMALSPGGDYLVLSLSGWREQGIQIVGRKTGRVTQTIAMPATFLGLAFSLDGQTLYASGGNEDAVFRYSWNNGKATFIDKIPLAEKEPQKDGTRFPAGLAVSRDGRFLYVAENVADMVAVIDLAAKSVIQRVKTDHYPYNVVVAPNNKVFVSSWGGDSVSVFQAEAAPQLVGRLKDVGRLVVGRHPSAMVLNSDGSRLFVASASADRITVVDAKKLRVIKRLADSPPSGTNQGSTPNSLALSPDGRRLYVAEADNNAVAVFVLSRATAGASSRHVRAHVQDRLLGRIPCDWYPTAVMALDDSLWVVNGKGRGSSANPKGRQPFEKLEDASTTYTLGQLNGTLMEVPVGSIDRQIDRFTRRVSRANNWNRPPAAPKYPPFKHVIYVIKENRTYDQIFGDLPDGDGDASLLFFSRQSTPNHRALAERFGLFDRFFVNAEVSQQGHQWSTAAYVTDYTEKTTPSIYSRRRAAPDDEGDVDDPVNGYLWDAALKKGLSVRNYGEYVIPAKPEGEAPSRYRVLKSSLAPHTNLEYPPYNMDVPDQKRADVWLKDLDGFAKDGKMPALQILHLPSDHTAGGRPGKRTPQACMADNDLALGRMVEALSNTQFWKDTVFFVLEDDAQDGPDHVDSHRSMLLVISSYNRGGTVRRFVNTTDVIATIEKILGLSSLSHFDHFGRPLQEIFSRVPDLRPYQAVTPAQSLNEMNPVQGQNASDSLQIDVSKEDVADMDLFNRHLWRIIKGDQVAYPHIPKISSLEYIRRR
jgi:YVTN family beta-propeller protein